MGFALFFLFGAIAPAHSLGHRDVLWLPLGDSITFGCTGPTIQDCHDDGGSYRVPLAFALSQPPLGLPNATSRYNVSTMGTLTTGPSYVPAQWLRHEGHPGWQIDRLDGSLKQSLATSAARPDVVTLHIGTNDCNANVPPTRMRDRLDSLLGHLLAMTPSSHVFLADVITTGNAWNACVLAFNALLPNVTATWVGKGMTLTHVPMQGWGCGAGGDLRDMCGGHQIHPTSAGYPRMASSFALKILQEYNPCSRCR